MRRSLALCSVLLAPCAVVAQSLDSVCTRIRAVAVGHWAEYRIAGTGGTEGTMRNQMVGTEARGDTTFWWHESLAESAEGTMVIRSLVPGYPFATRDVRELVMKLGADAAVRMPAHMLAMMQAENQQEPTFTSVEECARAETVGWETVTTPAGDIRALHVRPAGAEGERVDLWLATAVPFGLVRLTADEVELLLVAYGADATSAVTEVPREMH